MERQDIKEFVESLETAAFQRGWATAIDTIIKSIKGINFELHAQKNLFSENTSSTNLPFRAGTDMAAIFAYMKTHPGLRGYEIIDGVNGTGRRIEGQTALT